MHAVNVVPDSRHALLPEQDRQGDPVCLPLSGLDLESDALEPLAQQR